MKVEHYFYRSLPTNSFGSRFAYSFYSNLFFLCTNPNHWISWFLITDYWFLITELPNQQSHAH